MYIRITSVGFSVPPAVNFLFTKQSTKTVFLSFDVEFYFSFSYSTVSYKFTVQGVEASVPF